MRWTRLATGVVGFGIDDQNRDDHAGSGVGIKINLGGRSHRFVRLWGRADRRSCDIDPGELHACLKGRVLYSVGTTAPKPCSLGGSVITWSQTGSAGPAGPAGPAGAAGAQAPAGPAGAKGHNGAAGAAGSAGAQGVPEAQGPAGPPGPAGTTNRISASQIAQLRWDQDPGRAATLTVGINPAGVPFYGSYVWIANTGSGTVSRIDPASNVVTTTVSVGTGPFGVAFDGSSICECRVGHGVADRPRQQRRQRVPLKPDAGREDADPPEPSKRSLAGGRRSFDIPPDQDERVAVAAAPLTHREAEVLALVATGWTNHKVGRVLAITERTVRKHLGNVYEKLGVSGRTSAAAWWATQSGNR